MTAKTLLAWLREEPFTLAMSSGFFGFFAHAGVLAALEEHGAIPAAVRGSSAGALVTGSWAAGLSAKDFAKVLFGIKRQDFWDPRPGFGVLRGRRFDGILRAMLPTKTFARCRVPTALSIYDVLGRRTELVTQGDLVDAIRASCALPVLFQPVMIDGRPKLDGGIADRPGLFGLAPKTRVLHHHLIPSSPWRKKNGAHHAAPQAPNLVALATPELPRLSPFALERGAEAFERAKAYTTATLAQPLP